MKEIFHTFAHKASKAFGSPYAFVMALLATLIWAALGPLCHFSDTWQLTINTGTTILTFLMVFLIQNTQNRDAVAFHLKLDELIRTGKGARNKLIQLEEMSDEELDQLKAEFERFCKKREESRRSQGQERQATATRAARKRHLTPKSEDRTSQHR